MNAPFDDLQGETRGKFHVGRHRDRRHEAAIGIGTRRRPIGGRRRATIDPLNGAEGILRRIPIEYRALLNDANLAEAAIQAIGIGFGGPVDVKNGIIETSHQIQGWTGFPLADWIRDRLGVAAVGIENDADAAGLGEAEFGAGVGCSPLVYVTIGSGIGGALIIDGSIYRGGGRGAVEIGHLRVRDAENSPSLEEVASGWSIGRAAASLAEDRREAPITAVEVAAAARRGDPACRAILQNAAQAMGQALAHVVTLLAPRRIILGGGVSLIGETSGSSQFAKSFKLAPSRCFAKPVILFPPLWAKRSFSTALGDRPQSRRIS